MAVFLLVRHADNNLVGVKLAGRMPDVHLNDVGRVQAQQLAEKLSLYPLKSVISSPLERTRETAEPIACLRGLQVDIFPELTEIDFGEWEGKSLKQLKRDPLWSLVQNKPGDFRFPGGESNEEAQNRIVGTLSRQAEKFKEKDLVVCVSHGDMIRLAVAHYLGMPINNFQRLRINTASITVMYLQGRKALFGAINHTLDSRKSLI